MFLVAKDCCTDKAVCIGGLPPLLLTFSAHLLPQTLQKLPVVMLVNHLAWRNKFPMNNALIAKKDHQHAFDV
jgi:hypothetical protein